MFKILFGEKWYILLYITSYFWYFFIPGGMIAFNFRETGDSGAAELVNLIFVIVTLPPILFIGSLLWVTTLKCKLTNKISIVILVTIIVPIILIYSFRIPVLFYIIYFGTFGLYLFMLRRFIVTFKKTV
jgi:hypothetical protein